MSLICMKVIHNEYIAENRFFSGVILVWDGLGESRQDRERENEEENRRNREQENRDYDAEFLRWKHGGQNGPMPQRPKHHPDNTDCTK